MRAAEERLYQILCAKGTTAPAVIGLDGFIDEVVRVVDVRENESCYASIPTMAAYAERIRRAAGLSTNIELARQTVKIGGNGPIMANAMGALDVPVTAVGLFGEPIQPVFRGMDGNCHLISVGEPGHTDAIEFSDGKIICSKLEPLLRLRWEDILRRVGLEQLRALLGECGLFALQNWTMLQHMSEIYEGLLHDVLPSLPPQEGGRIAFFDIADPEKRSDGDLQGAVGLIGTYSAFCRVALSLNQREAERLARVMDVDTAGGLEDLARGLREAMGITWVILHLVERACLAGPEGTVQIEGPYCAAPVLTTGAGDNFNAGAALGLMEGLDGACVLLAGAAASGFYVRRGRSAGRAELAEFLKEWCEHGL